MLKYIGLILLILIILYFLITLCVFAFSMTTIGIFKPFLKKMSKDVKSTWAPFVEKLSERKKEAGKLESHDVSIRSFDNKRLVAHIIETENPSRVVICVHGYKEDGYKDFSASLKWLHDNGCNIVLIEQRGCGISDGKIVSFGAKEKDDVVKWVEYAEKHYSEPIYLYGISLGAATVLMDADKEFNNVKGIIADCGFCSLRGILTSVSNKWFKLNTNVFFPGLNFWCHLFGHFGLDDVDTTKTLSKAKYPVLFFHGTKDNFVPMENTVKNVKACTTKCKAVYVEGAPHGMCIAMDTERYLKEVKEFFDGDSYR